MTRVPVFARRGFALLIVLTLLALLVVLLIGLASVTRVETAVAGNVQRQAQARENALLALNLAVAQLQRYAGPDQRVTATADAIGGTHKGFTGVWDSSGVTPVTWLVSGNEIFTATGANDPLAVTPSKPLSIAGANANAIELVGRNTSGTAADVIAPWMPIRADGLAGAAANTTIGRYAWWVGDQGVKASVAVGDTTNDVISPPFDSTELRKRISQQVPLGSGPFDVSAKAPVFEPRNTNNDLLARISAINELAFLKSGSTAIGLPATRTNFHSWSPNNFGVLANSNSGGLRQDLSLDPSLLGSEFAAWANYPMYMDVPAANIAGLPSYATESVARRYRITSPSIAVGATTNAIAPVLAFCLVSFNCQTSSASGVHPLQARAKAIIGLWNPYTSALVPPVTPDDDLRAEISGLPIAEFVDAAGTPLASLPLQQMFAPAIKVVLPWAPNNPRLPGLSAQPDFQSWLPGRVYYWTSLTDTTGERSVFYQKNFAIVGGGDPYFTRISQPAQSLDGSTRGQWIVRNSTQLTVTLFHGSDPTPLATYTSPSFLSFPQNDEVAASHGNAQFGFLFRAAQNLPDPTLETWLAAAGRDPRDAMPVNTPESPAFVTSDPLPTQYGGPGTPSIDRDELLLDRTMGSTGQTYNEDVPVFELPRSPMLSLGAVQHLALPGQRPFSVGNSWGATVPVNGFTGTSVFDQFYFSGLSANSTPAAGGAVILPNVRLKVLPRDSGGGTVSVPMIEAAPSARSSKYILASSAFNANSTNRDAWAAILRSIRPIKIQEFRFLDADENTGTADETAIDAIPRANPATWEPDVGDALFFRYSQSAQETYKAEAGRSAGGTPSLTPPSTELFRRGLIKLTSVQVATLAEKIADAVRARQSIRGPFRNLEEFLNPTSPGGPSLIEQAIADANINVDATGNPIEFSSQFLTQADIMTALAPVLFARSDTFLVRAYGEAVNPVTGATEGRAWCEATVQRVPEYFDPTADDATVAPADLVSDFNKLYGRRFKVVSFRWLTRSDI
jgi:hypothetical protein